MANFLPGARVLIDGRDEAIVKHACPGHGCSSQLSPHYHVNFVGGDDNVRVSFERVGVERKPDFIFNDHGSIWLVTPQNDAAREHLAENVGADAQWMGRALAVEARYVANLAQGLKDNGYSVGV